MSESRDLCHTSRIDAVPLSIALIAGSLSVVNPCGFPLLPAFLSFYLGADEALLPRAPTRIAQGLLAGGLVALGFLGLFAAVGLPLSFGVGTIADAVPWVGLATGAALVVVGLVCTAGRSLGLRHRLGVRARVDRGVASMLLFGVGYGLASLGCTLPIFLALVGASLGAHTVAVFAAYGAGMAVVLMALSVAVACAREGVVRRLHSLVPVVGRLAGVLLVAAGGYLVYYWARVRFGDAVTLADDPVVGLAGRYSAELESFARQHGTPILSATGAVVAAALVTALPRVRRLRARQPSRDLARR